MIIFAAIPTTIWYATPLFLFFIISWVIQSKFHKTIDNGHECRTKMPSNDFVKSLLQEHKVPVEVETGDNYSHNDYDPEQKKILVSPTTVNETDYTSLACMINAVEHAILHTNDPKSADTRKKIACWETILFWCVFCVIAAGLMKTSLTIVLAGYALAIIPAILQYYLNKTELKRNLDLMNKTKLREKFQELEWTGIEQVLRAHILKY